MNIPDPNEPFTIDRYTVGCNLTTDINPQGVFLLPGGDGYLITMPTVALRSLVIRSYDPRNPYALHSTFFLHN